LSSMELARDRIWQAREGGRNGGGAAFRRACCAIGRCPASERKASRRREIAASKPIKDQVEKVAVAYLKHAKARTRESTFTETKRAFDRTNFVRMARSAPIGNHKKPMFESLSAGSNRPAPISAN
jgi:hypothetical protein